MASQPLRHLATTPTKENAMAGRPVFLTLEDIASMHDALNSAHHQPAPLSAPMVE